MATIPNLKTLRTGRGGPKRRGGGTAVPGDDGSSNEANAEATRDKVIQQTDQDASSSRRSAVALGYLEDGFLNQFYPPSDEVVKRYPIINRGTYVRTKAIDQLLTRFLKSNPKQRKQIISLGAGSDTRFFRFWADGTLEGQDEVQYHEIDFEANVIQKREKIRSSQRLSSALARIDKDGIGSYHLHALDLRDLTAISPPSIPNLDPTLPTLLLSECCLCYLPPETTTTILQYFSMHINAPLSLILYEPIRPFDAFGRTMVSNLASRGIHMQTLKRYASLETQRQRLRLAGFTGGQGARDVYQLWESEAWVGKAERERVEKLEWLDEIEEWKLLASHYCIAWGWRGEVFSDAWRNLDGSKTNDEVRDDEIMG